MGSPLPPDPYAALGVPKDATAAAIKTAHRKLVLKCHPVSISACPGTLSANPPSQDKVTDPAAKEAASDKFHKIQSAYEILIDDNRRERYDAQLRLAELRKEVLSRQSDGRSRGADARSNHKTSHEPPTRSTHARASERVTPQYEERRPPPQATSYFESQPRSAPRKEPEYSDRPSRRAPSEVREKPKASSRSSKESERERKREKTRQAERETRKERERKYTTQFEDGDSDSESDESERRSRRMREDDVERRLRDEYHASNARQQRETDHYYDDRARKMAAQGADAREYIMSSRGGARPRAEPERRPSPPRVATSKDRVEYIKRGDGRPAVVVRRGSEKPSKESSKKEKEREKEKESSRKTTTRTPERRTSAETVEERKPPPLSTSKSSPADIRIPTEKARAASSQPDTEPVPIPHIRRSETMPYNTSRRSENVAPKSSKTTPSTESHPAPTSVPDNSGTSPSKYARQYTDDVEYSSPDGYRTEVREPLTKGRERPQVARKITRSPSPVKEREQQSSRESIPRTRDTVRETREPREPQRESRESRESRAPTRAASARYQERPTPSNTRTSYVYGGPDRGVEQFDRGVRPRELSPRTHQVYGEIRPPTVADRSRYNPYIPAEEGIRYAKPFKAEDIKMASGRPRPNGERPQARTSASSGSNVYQYHQAARA
jgi:curved DNA-binding protein CbpA